MEVETMDTVLDVAFVIAIVAFIKTQIGLVGPAVLGVAFAVALFFGLAPLIATMIPVAAPFIKVVLDTVVLFLGAAGSVDFIHSITRKRTI